MYGDLIYRVLCFGSRTKKILAKLRVITFYKTSRAHVSHFFRLHCSRPLMKFLTHRVTIDILAFYGQ